MSITRDQEICHQKGCDQVALHDFGEAKYCGRHASICLETTLVSFDYY